MSLDLEARANSMISTVQAEWKATGAAPSSTTTGAAARDHEITLLDEVLREVFRKYAAPSNICDWRQMIAILLGDLTGKELLDYGCGIGEESVYFARLGARVTTLDVSEVGVSTLEERAEHPKLDNRAFEMHCDPTRFRASSFDRIHGVGLLHHVGAETALEEVWRLLRPGGMGVFLEPMGDSSTIEAAKAFLMKHARFLAERDEATAHEPNLTWKDIEASTRRFSRVTTYPYHLLYRLKRFIPRSMRDTVLRFDHGLLSVAPGLRRYAGAVIIQVVK